jgi:starch synthase
MCAPTVEGLGDALARAVKLFVDKPRYAAAQQRAMARDFSWKQASLGYETLYSDAL